MNAAFFSQLFMKSCKKWEEKERREESVKRSEWGIKPGSSREVAKCVN